MILKFNWTYHILLSYIIYIDIYIIWYIYHIELDIYLYQDIQSNIQCNECIFKIHILNISQKEELDGAGETDNPNG